MCQCVTRNLRVQVGRLRNRNTFVDRVAENLQLYAYPVPVRSTTGSSFAFSAMRWVLDTGTRVPIVIRLYGIINNKGKQYNCTEGANSYQVSEKKLKRTVQVVDSIFINNNKNTTFTTDTSFTMM